MVSENPYYLILPLKPLPEIKKFCELEFISYEKSLFKNLTFYLRYDEKIKVDFNGENSTFVVLSIKS